MLCVCMGRICNIKKGYCIVCQVDEAAVIQSPELMMINIQLVPEEIQSANSSCIHNNGSSTDDLLELKICVVRYVYMFKHLTF